MTDTDAIRDRAIEAAAQAKHDDLNLITPWENLSEGVRNIDRNTVTPLVDAVLAVAGPAYRAEAFEDAADSLPSFEGAVVLGACGSCVRNTLSDVEAWLYDRANIEAEGKHV